MYPPLVSPPQIADGCALFGCEADARPVDFRVWMRRGKGMTPVAMKSQALLRMTIQRALAVFCAILALLAIQAYRGHGTGALAATIGAHDDPVDGQTGIAPMPFEQAGESFPGSAYYYIAREVEPQPTSPLHNAISVLAPGLHWNSQKPAPQIEDSPLANSGPAARAMTGLTSAIDRTRAESCLTAAIYYEAASEPDDGQRAVAQVILNRVAHPSYPKTVCGVVFQGSERSTGCQFTFTCNGALARKPSRYFWDRAQSVARTALAGYVYAPAGLATHYHTFAVHPYWADSLNFIGQIGAHRFYRFYGPAGTPNAFRFAYAGGEPLPQAHQQSALTNARPDLANDPVALERAYEAQLKPASAPQGPVHPAPAYASPQYTGEVMRHGGDAAYRAANLPEVEAVRPEYQNSGRWISDPQ
jgi:hypothetical protein